MATENLNYRFSGMKFASVVALPGAQDAAEFAASALQFNMRF